VVAGDCAADSMSVSLRFDEQRIPRAPQVPTRLPVPILMVDDNPAKRLALKAVLSPLGYSVVEADSGRAALRCIMAQNFAVILLDVQMPVMDGFETAARIRQRRQSEMTPIIFITAHATDEVAYTDMYAEGAVDFIFAPVPPNELRAKVAAFANLYLRAEELAAQARGVQQSADQLRLLADAAPIGIFQTDADDRYIYTNPRWSEITGISRSEAEGRKWDAIIRMPARSGLFDELPGDCVEDGAEICRRFEIRLPGSSPRTVLATSTSIPDREGGTAGGVGILADVTAASREREASEALHAAEEQYRRIVETTMEGIWLVDTENCTTFVNDALANMLATTPAEMQGRPIFEYCCDDEGLRTTQAAVERRRTGVNEQYEVKLWRSDGTEMHALVSASSLTDDSGNYTGSLSMIRDVTERVEQEERRHGLEEQLRQSHRLESIGQLAGGIAHDFNNLLLGIRGYGELALRRIERGEDTASEDIKDMLEAAERATQLTRQLLAFGRRQVLQPEVIDMREVISDMGKLLHQLIGDQIELAIATPEAAVLVEADRTQLEQVIANLAVNARDAMPDGGRLAIEVALSDEETPEAVLTVTDDGSGMDGETARRVFEPFFSTKGAAGSGFGLATVHGIVSQSGGRIGLESRLGKGSKFSIFLPLSNRSPAQPMAELAEVEGGAETILVVEDDAMVRRIVTGMLEELGYRVLAADGGEAALDLVATWASSIDLILTDLVMPGPSGRETAERIRKLFPDAKVLYMSGYTDDVVIRDGGAFEPGIAFIQKPFGPEQLGRCVREVLGQERT
jgi:two-component system cell cycle sensor histidine kinase/response regulator CckA